MACSKHGGHFFHSHPVCAASEASRHFLNGAATPPHEEGTFARLATLCAKAQICGELHKTVPYFFGSNFKDTELMQ